MHWATELSLQVAALKSSAAEAAAAEAAVAADNKPHQKRANELGSAVGGHAAARRGERDPRPKTGGDITRDAAGADGGRAEVMLVRTDTDKRVEEARLGALAGSVSVVLQARAQSL